MTATLTEVLRRHAEHQPERLAYSYLEDGLTVDATVTYGQLSERVHAIGRELAGRFAPGERVLLLHPPGLEFVASLFGCWHAGLVAVPAYPPAERSIGRLTRIIADSGASVVLTTSDGERRMRDMWPGAGLPVLATDVPSGGPCDCDIPLSGGAIAVLQYTSGSTTDPRGVLLTHDNLMGNLDHIRRSFGHTSDTRAVSWLPPYHDMGLIGGLLQPMYVGFPMTLMSPTSFVRDPFRWLRAVSEFGATSSGAPNFAYDLALRRVTPEQRDELDLSGWRVAFSGSEPVRGETMARFAEYFAPCGFRQEAFFPCYGLAEATLMVSGGDLTSPPVTRSVDRAQLALGRVAPAEDGYPIVGVGTSMPGQRVEIVDPLTAMPRAVGEIGEVWVAGSGVAQGYWNRPEETAEVFRATLADTEEGPFLRTGDLGFLDDGELFITGRLKDLIIIRGRNRHPEDIERTVARADSVLRPDRGAAFSVPVDGEEQLVVVHEVEPHHRDRDLTEVITAVRELIAVHHEVRNHAVVLVRPGGIPRTTSGKVQRSQCRDRFLRGELPVVAQDVLDCADGVAVPSVDRDRLVAAGEQERRALVGEFVHHLVARALRIPLTALKPARALTEHGLDSVASLELAHDIEVATGVVVAPTAILHGRGVADLVEVILSGLAAPPEAPPVPVGGDAGEYPLSPGQQAMWVMHRLAAGSGTYNVACAVRIVEGPDAATMRAAFAQVIERHAVLRTTYPTVGGAPVQVRHDEIADWFHHEVLTDTGDLQTQLDSAAALPFDLDWEPALRVHLFTTPAGDHVLLLVAHHIAVDFWSMELLLREFGECCEDLSAGRESRAAADRVDHLSHVDWQSRLLDGQEGDRLRDYWRDRLTGTLPVLRLPGDRPRPSVPSQAGASHYVEIGGDVVAGLRRLAAAEGTTLFTVLLAAYQVLLHRYTADEESIVGVPMSGRSRAAFSGLIGYLSNTVPVRTTFAGEPSFTDILRQVRDVALEAADHQDYPFSRLVEDLGGPRDVSRSPVFQTTFTFQSSRQAQPLAALALGVPGLAGRIGGLSVESVALNRQVTQFDLALAAAETDRGLAALWTYSTDLFDAGTVSRIGEHFRVLLREVLARPHRQVTRLSLRTGHENRMLSIRPAPPVRSLPSVAEMFGTQATRTPDAVAVTDGTTSVTYRELNRRADRLAGHLRSLGVGHESVVALSLRPGIDYVVVILAVLRAGAAYLPLDPAYPRSRLAFMMRDSGVVVVVTDNSADLTGIADDVTVCDPSGVDTANQTGDWPAASPDGLACLFFTSGTTGEPKGVMVTNAGLAAQVNALQAEFSLGQGDRQLLVQSFAFAASMRQLFVPLCHGATVVLAGPDRVANAVELFDFAHEQGVTVMSANPSYWQHCAELLGPEVRRGSLRLLQAASEPMPAWLPGRWMSALGGAVTFANMLGHTELSGIAAVHRIPDGDEPRSRTALVGRPITGVREHVLDKGLAPVPFGAPGELYLGGQSLSRGYWNQPGLTAQRFVADPFSAEPGARLYRTGDLVRYRAGGAMEHLGRADDQVKVRGFRIEPGEVEAALQKHPEVLTSAVIARQDGTGEHRLIGYVVPVSGVAISSTALRTHLLDSLPEHLVPSVFVTLPELPRNPNGKVDRRALPEPASTRPKLDEDFVSPHSATERRLAEIWADLLGVDRIGLHDNFFDLGGTSLSLLKAHQLVCTAFDVNLPITTLFQKPTVHALAGHLAGAESGPAEQVTRGRSTATRRRGLVDEVRNRRRGESE